MIAAWLTLVWLIPAFCSRMTAPKPTAPESPTLGVSASRRPRRPTIARIGADATNLITVSQLGSSQRNESLDSATVIPQRDPAAIRAKMALRFFIAPNHETTGPISGQ